LVQLVPAVRHKVALEVILFFHQLPPLAVVVEVKVQSVEAQQMELTVAPGVLVVLLLPRQHLELALWDKEIVGEQTIQLTHMPLAAEVAPVHPARPRLALSLETVGLVYNRQYQVLQHITLEAAAVVRPIILVVICQAPVV
jgi:hypothetical protein